MSNREIINYILDNKLKQDDVIKEIEEDITMYIYNDGFDMWDVNGIVGILRFKDDKNLNLKYEIITEEQAEKEIYEKEKREKIQRLKKQLIELEESDK